MYRLAVFFLAAALLAGCVPRTEMTSFVDPAFRGAGPSFSSVVVFAAGIGLEERQIIEDSVVEAFAVHKVRALRGVDVIPPTRDYTDAEWAGQVLAAGVEAVLFIGVGGKDVTETYVPPTYYPGSTYGTATTYGNTTYVDIYQSPGYTVGGYSISKPFAAYAASVISVADGLKAWQADAKAGGNAFHSFNDLSEQVARDTVEQLVADGLF